MLCKHQSFTNRRRSVIPILQKNACREHKTQGNQTEPTQKTKLKQKGEWKNYNRVEEKGTGIGKKEAKSIFRYDLWKIRKSIRRFRSPIGWWYQAQNGEIPAN